MRRVASCCAAILVSGCATNYVPRSPTRLSIVMRGGSIAYQKGNVVHSDFLGSGLVDAVKNDPDAEEAAETYYHRNIGGLVAFGVGLGCLAGGLGTLGTGQQPSTSRDQLAIGLLIGALAAEITGTVLIATAQPYQFDAINIYNDHAEQRLLAPRYPYPYPYPYYPPGRPPLPPGASPPGRAPSGAAPSSVRGTPAPARSSAAPAGSAAAPAGSAAAPATSASPPGPGSAAPPPPPPPAP